MKIAFLFLIVSIVAPISGVFGQESTREEFREFVGSVEGRWIGSTTWVIDTPFGKKGEKTTTYFESEFASDGNILIGKYHAGEGTGSWILSYDPGSKQIKVLSTDSGGGYSEGIIEKKDGQWTELRNGTTSKGAEVSMSRALTISNGGDTHTWTVSVKIDGNEEGNSQNAWQRVYKPARK